MNRFDDKTGCALIGLWLFFVGIAVALNVVIIWAIIKAVLHFT